MNNKKCYGPFQLWVLNNFPFTIDDWDSITQYQMLCKCLGALKEQLDVNSDLYKKISDLDNYVKNLDLQDEVNNKLDEMASDGTLQEIITEYINLKSLLVFDKVSDLKNATNLVNGSYVKTLGYHSKNDDGQATYYIREVTNQDVVDEATIIALNNFENLIAVLIYNDINLITFGCYGDGTHDDTNKIKLAITNALSTNKKIISPSNKNYLISDTLKPRYINADFNFSTIITNDEIDLMLWDDNEDGGKIENLFLDCNSVALSGLRFDLVRRCYFNNIKIWHVDNYGIKINYDELKHSWELHFNNIFINGGDHPESSVGILYNSSDSFFNNIIMININTNFYSTLPTYGDFSNIHCYNLKKDVNLTATMIKVTQGIRWNMTNICNDGIPTFFKFDSNDSSIQPFLKVNGLYVEYSDADYTSDLGYSNSLILDVPASSNTPRISIQNGILAGLNHDETNLYTYFLSNNKVFLGDLSGTTLLRTFNTGREGEVIINANNVNAVAENVLTYKDGGIINLRITFKLEASKLNQQYLEIGTIPEEFRCSRRIFATGSMSENADMDNIGTPSINSSCYISQSDGTIKIASQKVGTNPQYNYFKLNLTYFKN